MKFKPMLEWLKANLWIVVFGAGGHPPARVVRREPHVEQEDPRQRPRSRRRRPSTTTSRTRWLITTCRSLTPSLGGEHQGRAQQQDHRVLQEGPRGRVEPGGTVAKAAENFNKGVGPEAAAVGRSEFKPLVDGLFPKVALTTGEAADANAAHNKEQAKLNEMERLAWASEGTPTR